MIAMALANNPQLLIADEPTTALDVTVQAQILDLLLDLRDRMKMAIILITHDLGVVAETCERALVMYAGRLVESGAAERILAAPRAVAAELVEPVTEIVNVGTPVAGVVQDVHESATDSSRPAAPPAASASPRARSRAPGAKKSAAGFRGANGFG